MSETRPIASLTPSLLARKGGARPTMLSQLHTMQQSDEATARQIDDDPSFDDMGEESQPVSSHSQHVAEVVAIKPEVQRQQEQLATHFGEGSRRSPQRRSALAEGRSAAFTLRLDADRHLKLRLACTLANRSAQQIVTDALDHMLASLPEVAELAARVGKRR